MFQVNGQVGAKVIYAMLLGKTRMTFNKRVLVPEMDTSK